MRKITLLIVLCIFLVSMQSSAQSPSYYLWTVAYDGMGYSTAHVVDEMRFDVADAWTCFLGHAKIRQRNLFCVVKGSKAYMTQPLTCPTVGSKTEVIILGNIDPGAETVLSYSCSRQSGRAK